MVDERAPAYIWPLIAGVCAGVLGMGCIFGGWPGPAPYPLIAGGILMLVAALIGDLCR